MSNLIIPQDYARYLPYDMAKDLAQLPEQAQYEFMEEMNSSNRSTLLMYIIHIFSPIPFSLGYVGKWLQQFLFWITFGGLGIWWLIMLITIPEEVREFNRGVARETFRMIAHKYKYAQRSARNNNAYSRDLIRQPEALDLPSFDPTFITLDHLKKGFLFDYNGQTWQVLAEDQFDNNKGESYRIFKAHAGIEEAYFEFKHGSSFKKIFFSKKVNIFQIDPELEEKVRAHQVPPNILYFKGHRFYREESDKGYIFDVTDQRDVTEGFRRQNWLYLNEERDVVLTIEEISPRTLSAFYGKYTDEHHFVDILPGAEA
ncbi:TM2 domain-containing protein [Flammeovirga sp. SubArs3]|uniref:TM2 domain-containing protein n=1 Tax=Flammeovirga sp. SubArs3 TaxID=2995316 RepID=UPI00248CAFEC|nr:TM2 domain-containing protein [Flammeovirga sp. SubArs3]